MKNLSKEASPGIVKQQGGEMPNPPAKVDMIAKGVVTGVVASAIIQTGRGIAGTLAKNPWLMFGLGVAAGALAAKYRKEIVVVSSQAAEQGKDFVLRQKQGLNEILALTQESTEKPED